MAPLPIPFIKQIPGVVQGNGLNHHYHTLLFIGQAHGLLQQAHGVGTV